MSQFENSAYDAQERGFREIRNSSTASRRDEKYGEDAPSDSDLIGDSE